MYLYKYVTAERIDVLKNQKVRFTQPAFLNDPFELSPDLAALFTDERVAQLLEKVKKIRTSNYNEAVELYQDICNYQPLFSPFGIDIVNTFTLAKIRDEVNLDSLLVLTLKEASKFINNNSGLIRDQLHTKFGILSLTEKNDNLLMWAHYANSHSGFVIEINGDHAALDLSSDYFGLIGKPQKVSYTIDRRAIELYNPDLDSKLTVWRIADNFFFTKSEDWAYEQEWRMVLPVEQQIHLHMFPCDCVTGIIFGARMEEDYKQELRELISSNTHLSHIQFRQALIDPHKFRINIVECN